MRKSIRLTPSQLRIDGQQVLKGLTKLGQGAFTYAYQVESSHSLLKGLSGLLSLCGDEVALVASCDPLKELYTMGWLEPLSEDAFGSQVVFPFSESIDWFDDGNYRLYAGVKYHKFSKKAASGGAWRAYRGLRDLLNGYSCAELSNKFSKENPNRYAEGLCEWIVSVCDEARNYGDDIRVEISPRNVALDDYGNLVLLDVFYSPKTLLSTKGW